MPSPAARSATAVSAEARRSSVDRAPSDDGAATDSIFCGESAASCAWAVSDESVAWGARELLVVLMGLSAPLALAAPPVLPVLPVLLVLAAPPVPPLLAAPPGAVPAALEGGRQEGPLGVEVLLPACSLGALTATVLSPARSLVTHGER